MHAAAPRSRDWRPCHTRSLLDDDLPLPPRMRDADGIIGSGFREGDRLRLALLQRPGIPVALLKRGCRVLDVTDIGEGDHGPGLNPSTGGAIRILDVVVADLDRIAPVRDRPRR